jgi:sugar O-acyltransferase (sialic acid O-acetyltransferase NeuD family)
MSSLLVVGAGGHAKVVADILICQGLQLDGFLDDDPRTWGTTRLSLPVLGGISTYADYAPGGLAMGIGDNAARERIMAQMGQAAQSLWRNAIHPRSIIAASAHLGRGVVVAAGTVLNPDSVLGDFVILNTGATVDHDCIVGEYAHLAPGTHLSGGVSIGRGTLVGVGATIAPGYSVGEWAVIGAGAVVVSNIPDRVIAIGVPARW